MQADRDRGGVVGLKRRPFVIVHDFDAVKSEMMKLSYFRVRVWSRGHRNCRHPGRSDTDRLYMVRWHPGRIHLGCEYSPCRYYRLLPKSFQDPLTPPEELHSQIG